MLFRNALKCYPLIQPARHRRYCIPYFLWWYGIISCSPGLLLKLKNLSPRCSVPAANLESQCILGLVVMTSSTTASLNIRLSKPRHLIGFLQWNKDMVMDVLNSALNLKCCHRDTHNKRLPILTDSKIMILLEENTSEPVLNTAVSKAATFLGASDVSVSDHLVWHHEYLGSIFGTMADAIFVCTSTSMCLTRMASTCEVPIICMKCRTHAQLQGLATIMAVLEEFGTVKNVNVAYLGPPHPVLNTYLRLCPMLGANIRFKCCCKVCPVSPLLLHDGEESGKSAGTEVLACKEREECLKDGCVIISGPSCTKKEKLPEFKVSEQDLNKCSPYDWIYFHTCPRGEEVDDVLFYHPRAKTMNAFENMSYISAALMAYCMKGHTF